jgi:signal transduction histidine kinase/HPt (histidine-containing phosphotransfer) domain-containing protein
MTRVLIVDDSPTFLHALADQLQDDHYDVVLAGSGEEALDLLQVQPVDCILLDLLMPEMSGQETCQRIKASPAWRSIPVVMLTAREDREAVIESFNAGADDFVPKSSDFSVLRARLVAQLRRREFEEENRRIHEQLHQQEIEIAEAHAARELARTRAALLADLERKNAELEQARLGAEAANEAKSRFLANISHELRTPMNAILGMTDLALGAELSPQVRDYLRTARSSADMLLAIVNEILDFSRIEAGKVVLESAPFRLRPILEETVKAISIRADEKGLKVGADVAPDVPDRLVGDSLRLRQILVNLVGNAIKFTEHGEVAVSVRKVECRVSSVQSRASRVERPESSVQSLERRDPGAVDSPTLGSRPSTLDSVILEFSVRDTGIGIAPEVRQHIFAPFSQADASTTRRYGGTGLGLSITSSLVRMMGGQIGLESQVGRGSTFHFTVCLGIDKDLSPAPDTRTDLIRLPPRRPLRILLVEDTPANQRLIQYLLRNRGHAVEIAANGLEAVDLAGRQDFDVVLMDVQMPVMDGYQATAAIRRLPNGRGSVPIIAMTAHAMQGDRQRCLEAGMDDYLSKPVIGQQLIELVERMVDPERDREGEGERGRSGERPEDLSAKTQDRSRVFNLDEAMSRCFGEPSLFHEMVECLFHDAEPLIEQARRALSHGIAVEVGRAAHRLKGTVCHLGAAPAMDTLQHLEQIGKSGDLSGAAETIQQLDVEIGLLKAALAPHRPDSQDPNRG